MTETFFLFIIFIIVIVIFFNYENLKVNLIICATLLRGIISQNCFWWGINDLLSDATGAEVYLSLKNKDRFVNLNILGEDIYLLTDIQDIQQLLDFSPNPFGPGKFKDNFFNTFIPKNVGISVNPDWKYRRDFNDKVLETDKHHHMNLMFGNFIQEEFNRSNPNDLTSFTEFTRRVTSRIIFGTYDYNDIIYKVFKQADSILSARFRVNTVDNDDLGEYREYLRYELENPKPDTLLALANKYHKMLPTDDVIDQIPHWVFPIAGLFSVHLPRLLVILKQHPDELERIQKEIVEKKYLKKDNYVRKCILELFRLNNAVNSTFRGLTEDYRFENSDILFKRGTQFVFFNNPVLRDLFENPNQFIPSRWNLELESSYRALMFNQANQRCPGKELVISLMTIGLVCFLQKHNFNYETNIKLNPGFIPYVINPCTIRFNF